MLAAYRVNALRGALPSEPANRPARILLELAHVLVHADAPDIDTREDLTSLGRKDPNDIDPTQR